MRFQSDHRTSHRAGRRLIRWVALAVTAALAFGLGLVSLAIPAAEAVGAAHSEMLLFDANGDSLNGTTYHSFRIPSLLRTTSNTLLAFAEGRATSNKDWGNINLVYKRSTDNGRTWSALKEVVGVGRGTWGNPTGVVDQSTGRIWMFMSWNPENYSQFGDSGTTKISQWGERRVYVTSSSDDGLHWTAPVDLTATLTPKTRASGSVWAWDAVGPGVGVQTTTGRLVIAAMGRNIYSDDHGANWTMQRLVNEVDGSVEEGTSEGTVLQLLDGRLIRNDRAGPTLWGTSARRWVARGTIEHGFSEFAPDPTLLDPRAEGSVLRYNVNAPARIIFLNSASTLTRDKMTVRISTDEGASWSVHRSLSDAPLPSWPELGNRDVAEGGYSSMAKTADHFVAALVEVDENTRVDGSHRSIVFRKFNLPWILAGTVG